MTIDFSKVIFMEESSVTLDEPKDWFYPIQISLWLKQGYEEVVVWWYWLELLNKPLVDHSKSMKGL